MAVEVVWSPQARDDLIEIYVAIGLERPDAAERYFERIERKIELLGEQPRLGGRRSEIWPSARMLVEAPYVILYETDPDTDEGPVSSVEIVRILDGRRDLATFF
jgi:toxin ParE1/3/4